MRSVALRGDGTAAPPGQSSQLEQQGKEQPVSGVPGAPPVLQAWAATVGPALAAAEHHLAGTVSCVHPGTSARTLLRIATRQRRQLSILARACRDLEPSLRLTPKDDSMTETTQHHDLTAGCPLTCLEGQLPARTFNALRRHLHWRHSGHPTVGHVADLLRQGRLADIRGLGVGGIEVIASLLKSAGLPAEPGPANRRSGSAGRRTTRCP